LSKKTTQQLDLRKKKKSLAKNRGPTSGMAHDSQILSQYQRGENDSERRRGGNLLTVETIVGENSPLGDVADIDILAVHDLTLKPFLAVLFLLSRDAINTKRMFISKGKEP